MNPTLATVLILTPWLGLTLWLLWWGRNPDWREAVAMYIIIFMYAGLPILAYLFKQFAR